MAELVATYALVFFGTVSATLSLVVFKADMPVAILFIGLTHGLVISIMIYAIGHVSGGHINPAVTLSLLAAKKIGRTDAVGYIASQLIGGTLGAATHAALLPRGAEISFGLNQPGSIIGNNAVTALGAEIILTFFLVLVVFGTAVHPSAPKGWAGFAIGVTIAVDHFIGIPISGASMNPARSLGPAIVSRNWNAHWVYWAGPVIGGLLAAAVYLYLLMRPEER